MYKVAFNACFGGFGLSQEAVKLAKSKADSDSEWQKVDDCFGFIDEDLIPRHDKILVEVIEELGERSSDNLSNIKVKTIERPCYRIEDYDGNETVETPEKLEWIVIED